MFNIFKKDTQLQKLSEEIERLTREVSALRAEKKDISEQRGLQDQIISLKKQITELDISRDKKKEDFDRREREINHMIGLEKKRQEFEIEQSVENARLEVREDAQPLQLPEGACFNLQAVVVDVLQDRKVPSLPRILPELL